MKHFESRWRFVASILLLCIFANRPALAQHDADSPTQLEAVETPDTAAGRQMEWVIRVINGETPLGEPEARFSDRFLEDFKPGELASELTSVRVDGLEGNPAVVVSIDQDETEESLTVTIQGRGTRRFLSVFLALDAKRERISGLVINVAMGYDGESEWDAFSGEAGESKGTASFAAYEIVRVVAKDGSSRTRLSPIHAFGDDKPLPIASAFKLWVLGALMEEIESGRLSWETRVAIADQWRSLPSGRMHNDPPGMSHSVRTLARAMIVESDNTATDHLIHAVGRERVESFMRGFTDVPDLNTPLLTTREMFSLKIPRQPWVRDEYLDADAPARRELIAPGGRLFRASPDPFMLRYWKQPTLVREAEWFASCSDLCRAMMRIQELSSREGFEPARESLAASRGVPLDSTKWPRIAYKVGSEPGVLSFCYLLTRDDGRIFVMAAIQASETEALDAVAFNELASRAARVLERFE